MAYICFNCGKGNWISERSQHHKGVAGGSWKHKAQKSRKVFRANLRRMRVNLDDTITRVKLCTDCLSKLKKQGQLSIDGQILKQVQYYSPKPATSS
jgi:ribosomal protein L28